MSSRIIYMGTPNFAVPAMERVALGDSGDLALVVTQPDRAAGRGRKHVAPAVKTAAERLGVPVLQTATLRDPEVRHRIIDIRPDLIIVAAFGMILGRWILELPARGCVNLHASLLPKYRGANPIAAAIVQGEEVTGVSLMQMDRGLDTGGVYATTEIDIELDDTAESLTQKLANRASVLLEDNMCALLDGTLSPVPQGKGATLTRQMTKADGWLDFARPAVEMERHIRATWPWPRAWTTDSAGERIQVHAASVSDEFALHPGQIAHADGQVVVGTGRGSLILRRVQLPGGRPMEGSAIMQVRSLSDGQVLGVVDRPEDLPPLVIPVPNDG